MHLLRCCFQRRNAYRVKLGLYFRRRQAPRTPPHDASVRGISWRAPAGMNVRQYRSKKYKRTQKLRKR